MFEFRTPPELTLRRGFVSSPFEAFVAETKEFFNFQVVMARIFVKPSRADRSPVNKFVGGEEGGYFALG